MKAISHIFSLVDLKANLSDEAELGFIFETIPVDVEAITKAYGITVDDTYKADYASKLGAVDGLNIWVNPKDANEFTALRRHIVAHELGHIVLHKPKTGNVLHFQDSVESIRGECPIDEPMEEACNKFAAELLMPEDKLMGFVTTLVQSSGGKVDASTLFTGIAVEFDVPKSLAERRVLIFVNEKAEDVSASHASFAS